MLRIFRNTAFVVVVLLTLTSCFKKVTTNTTLMIKALSEEASGKGYAPADGSYAYIYYTPNKEWTITSYEDAAAKIITHPETGEQMTTPNVECAPWSVEDDATTHYLSLFQSKALALVVVVYPAAQMYAYIYRKSEAENLTYTYLTLIFHKWKNGTYNEGSKDGYKWTVVAPEKVEEEPQPNE